MALDLKQRELASERSKRWYQNRTPEQKEELRRRQRDWYRNHTPAQRDEYLRRMRERKLWSSYRISPVVKEAMMLNQGGLCAVCRESPATHIDHCHQSGRVRGILCNSCNLGLGKFKDNPASLKAAATYLERF